jgi:hypothetical protein
MCMTSTVDEWISLTIEYSTRIIDHLGARQNFEASSTDNTVIQPLYAARTVTKLVSKH